MHAQLNRLANGPDAEEMDFTEHDEEIGDGTIKDFPRAEIEEGEAGSEPNPKH